MHPFESTIKVKIAANCMMGEILSVRKQLPPKSSLQKPSKALYQEEKIPGSEDFGVFKQIAS